MTGGREALAAAKRFHQSGDLPRAENGYLSALESEPDNADALYFLGALRLGQNRLDEAAGLLRRSALLQPENAPAHDLLGVVLAKQGDREGAVVAFRRSLECLPDQHLTYCNLGKALLELGRAGEAEAAYRRAVQIRPRAVESCLFLGRLLSNQGRHVEALPHLEAAARESPNSPDVHQSLGVALANLGSYARAEEPFREAARLSPNTAEVRYNLGTTLSKLGKHDEAEICLREAVRLKPNFADAITNLGSLLSRLNRAEEALGYCREAVRLAPSSAPAHLNLGSAFSVFGELDEAESAYNRALELQPNWAEAIHNQGGVELRRNRPSRAVTHYEKALSIAPDTADFHKDLGIALLLLGDFRRGWDEYEWRFKTANFRMPAYRQPRWDGTPLQGRTILLTPEQGIGDVIHFIRYTSLVQGRGGRVTFVCPAPLKSLLAGCRGIDRLVVEGDDFPEFDVHASLMSLPLLCGTTLESIPAEIPYLHADPGLVELWRRELGKEAGDAFRIGIAWQGSRLNLNDRSRSFRLAHFAELARIPGVRLYSLQKGAGAEQVEAERGEIRIVDLGPGLDETSGAFMDSAAVMKNLDLVVTADTSLAHLAGALGIPVWVALPFAADWRWMLDREDTPWYPSMRLFRQEERGDWGGVFKRMARSLRERVGARSGGGCGPMRVEVGAGELLDKITILEIKNDRMNDESKLAHVRRELESLRESREDLLGNYDLRALEAELKSINERLWEVEDAIRRLDAAGDFGDGFIALARSVYLYNDRRAELKRAINEQTGSRMVEEKSYQR